MNIHRAAPRTVRARPLVYLVHLGLENIDRHILRQGHEDAVLVTLLITEAHSAIANAAEEDR